MHSLIRHKSRSESAYIPDADQYAGQGGGPEPLLYEQQRDGRFSRPFVILNFV